MSIATEILSLRRDQGSSVSALLAALEWQSAAKNDMHILARTHDVMRIADLVLLNVAVHAGEALNGPPTTRRTRRSVVPFRRKSRRTGPGELYQRRLFA